MLILSSLFLPARFYEGVLCPCVLTRNSAKMVISRCFNHKNMFVLSCFIKKHANMTNRYHQQTLQTWRSDELEWDMMGYTVYIYICLTNDQYRHITSYKPQTMGRNNQCPLGGFTFTSSILGHVFGCQQRPNRATLLEMMGIGLG